MNAYRTVIAELFANFNSLRAEDQLIAILLDALAEAEDLSPQPNSVDCAFSEVLVRTAKYRGTPAHRHLAQRLDQTGRVKYKAVA